MLAVLDVEIGEEDHLEASGHVRVVVDHLGHGVDELDDQLGHEVAGSGLAAEDEGAGRDVAARVLLEPVVEGDDVQHVQVLPLVLVDPLHLDVEEGVRIDGDPGPLLDQAGKIGLVGLLDLPPLFLEYRIVGQLLQPRQLLSRLLTQPSPMLAGDQSRQAAGCSGPSSAGG